MANSKKKVSAIQGPVKLGDLTGKPATNMELTEVEKTTFGIVLERLNQLQTDFQKVQVAVSGMVDQSVKMRGLDPKKFGVNLAAGKILPIDVPSVPVKPEAVQNNGKDPNES